MTLKHLNHPKRMLMSKIRETILEIDLGALAHNFRYLKSKTARGVKIMGVVKAFAYGNAADRVALKLNELGIDYFGVAYTPEGISLRNAGIEKPILVFHPQPVNFEKLIDHCLEAAIYSELTLIEFIKTAEDKNQKNYPIHLKLNTGLNRLGFSKPHLNKVFDLLSKTDAVKVVGIYSHMAASQDWREREFSLQQITSFRKMCFEIVNFLGYSPTLHLSNTSAILNYPEAAFNMVRCGIGLYGFGNDPEINKNLKPIGTLKTIISQIQHLEPGDTVGYNRTFKASEKLKIATLPLGYADGIKRQYGNESAEVLVNGKLAPIIGNVCMDIIMINITGIDCEEGDEVIIFGGEQHASGFAKSGDTISYELITGVSQRVKRVFIGE